MKTFEELFEMQKAFEENVMNIEPGDNPLEFYHSVLGMIEECSETLNEDTRYKEEVFHKPGYKNKYDYNAKKREIADIAIYLMNTCIFSGITPEEFTEAIENKMIENKARFAKHRAVVISAFPGTGKSYTTKSEHFKELIILDSDSSNFSWADDEHTQRHPDFPNNYMDHIEENLDKADIIFVSSHKAVRDAMKARGIKFQLVYPERFMKEVYMNNYHNRGNTDAFINVLNDNWDNWLDEMEAETCEAKYKLGISQYMMDVIDIALMFGRGEIS